MLQYKKIETLEEIASQLYRGIKENRFDLAKGSIGLAYSIKIIDDDQKRFLTDLVTKTESDGIDEAIKILGSEKDGAGFYFQDTEQLNAVANTFLSLYADKHAPEWEVARCIKNLRAKVAEMHKELENLTNLDDKENNHFVFTRNKSKYILGELEIYENFYEGKPFKLYSLLTDNPETPGQHELPNEEQIEINNLFIRKEIEKITKLEDYFNKKIDKFVVDDIIQLATVCYISKNLENFKELVKPLISKSGLEDITPKVGDIADFHNHKVREKEIGYNTFDKIIEVWSPGFKYNGQVWERPVVYVGR